MRIIKLLIGGLLLLFMLEGCGQKPVIIEESHSRGEDSSSAALTQELTGSAEATLPFTEQPQSIDAQAEEGQTESQTLPSITDYSEESQKDTKAVHPAARKNKEIIPGALAEEGQRDLRDSLADHRGGSSTKSGEDVTGENTENTEAASGESKAEGKSGENDPEARPTPEALPPVTPLPSPGLTGQRLEGVNYDAYLPVPSWAGRGEASPSLAMKYGGYYTKNASEKVIYLTFCMDYENGYTKQMMDTLASLGIRSCFFITGTYLSRRPDMARSILNRGHILGSHSYRHLYTHELSDVELINDFVLSQRLFRDALGVSLQYYRPAYGSITERDMVLAQRFGLTTVMFSFNYADYDLNNQPGKGAALERLKGGLRPGAIYYLHVTPCNIQALPDFAAYARSQGYSFLRLDQNSGGETPQPTQPQPTAPPATSVPATAAPTTPPPATEAPATEAPATEAPATPEAATDAESESSGSEIPSEAESTETEAASTEASAASEPALTEAPATEAPATEAAATEAPASTETPADTETPANTEAPAAPSSETSPESAEPPSKTEGESETKPPEESPAA